MRLRLTRVGQIYHAAALLLACVDVAACAAQLPYAWSGDLPGCPLLPWTAWLAVFAVVRTCGAGKHVLTLLRGDYTLPWPPTCALATALLVGDAAAWATGCALWHGVCITCAPGHPFWWSGLGMLLAWAALTAVWWWGQRKALYKHRPPFSRWEACFHGVLRNKIHSPRGAFDAPFPPLPAAADALQWRRNPLHEALPRPESQQALCDADVAFVRGYRTAQDEMLRSQRLQQQHQQHQQHAARIAPPPPSPPRSPRDDPAVAVDTPSLDATGPVTEAGGAPEVGAG